jgi:hypothetical protein
MDWKECVDKKFVKEVKNDKSGKIINKYLLEKK